MNDSQVQSIHTEVLSILVNFEMDVLIKKKTLLEPLSVQVDLNRGIKEGLILLWLFKQMMIANEHQKISKPQFSNLTTTNLSSPFDSKGGSWGKY